MEAILYAEVYLICIIIVGLVMSWTFRANEHSASERWFKLVLVCYFCNFISNLLFTLVNNGLLLHVSGLSAPWFFKSCYFLTLSAGVCCWGGYTETELGHDTSQDLRKQFFLLLPVAVPVLIILSNYRTHLLFRIGEDHVYDRGPLFHVLMLFLTACALAATIRILLAMRHESEPVRLEYRRLMCTFPLCMLAAWTLSSFGEKVPVICICITVQLLCLYVGSLNRQISLDKLTQVNNRQNLNGYLSYKLRQHTDELFLLMIDVDYFKDINDTYGHLEGDAALIRVADALKHACTGYHRRPYIARYGGDEFIVAAELPEEEVRDLCRRIRNTLKELNTAAKAPYQLELSIGCAKWKEGMTHTRLISEADDDLYRVKKNRTGNRN